MFALNPKYELIDEVILGTLQLGGDKLDYLLLFDDVIKLSMIVMKADSNKLAFHPNLQEILIQQPLRTNEDYSNYNIKLALEEEEKRD